MKKDNTLALGLELIKRYLAIREEHLEVLMFDKDESKVNDARDSLRRIGAAIRALNDIALGDIH